MNIYITGIAGFLGTNLAIYLQKLGHTVIGCDNLICGSGNVSILQKNKIDFIDLDVCNGVSHHLASINVIINLACPASPKNYQKYPWDTMKTSVLGAEQAAWFAIRNNAFLIHASSSEVYGNIHGLSEDNYLTTNPLGPRAMYAEGKRAAEAIIQYHRKENKVQAATLRIFNTYGPYMELDDGRVIPNFLSRIGGKYPVEIPGNQSRSFLYVDDFCNAIEKIIERKATGTFNIGNPIETSMIKLATLFTQLFDGEIEFVRGREKEIMRRVPNILKATNDLDWFPKISLTDGLRKTHEWLISST